MHAFGTPIRTARLTLRPLTEADIGLQEALGAFIEHGFAELGLNRIEADTDPRNERSMRLLERLHFVHEGNFRERWVVDGEVSDAAMFGLLRRDWPQRA